METPTAPERDPIVAELVAQRRRAGITQQQVADTIGMARESLSRIESGHVSPRLSLLIRYAAAVGAVVCVADRRIDVVVDHTRTSERAVAS